MDSHTAGTGISVLIRTFNSGRTLPRVLSALPLLDGDELLIVDSGSTDDTLAIAQRHGARVIQPEGPFNYSKSLNAGFAVARNPWVLVLSSHNIPGSTEMLGRLRSAAAGSGARVVVIYGQHVLWKPADADAAPECIDKAWWEKTRCVPGGGNAIGLYRRVCWEEHRFDEKLATAEDLEWFLWATGKGYGVLLVPQAWALYRNQGSLRHMFHKGWSESIQAGKLIHPQALPFSQATAVRNLLICSGSLCKKLLLGRIPPGTWLREIARAAGGYAAGVGFGKAKKFPSPKGGASNTH